MERLPLKRPARKDKTKSSLDKYCRLRGKSSTNIFLQTVAVPKALLKQLEKGCRKVKRLAKEVRIDMEIIIEDKDKQIEDLERDNAKLRETVEKQKTIVRNTAKAMRAPKERAESLRGKARVDKAASPRE